MSYTLERFGTIVLPLYNRRTDATPVLPRQALVSTAAGTFDAYGSERAPQKLPHTITLACTLAEDSTAALRTKIDALRAAVGTRATLYRRADDDGAVHRCTARLVDVDYQRQRKNLRHQELKLEFQQLDAWRGKIYENWTLDGGKNFDDGYYFDGGAVALGALGSITVGGNLPALDVRATLVVTGTTNPTFCQIYSLGNPACVVTIDDTITPGSTYYIDSAARTATKNGADAYALIDLDTALDGSSPAQYHTADEWLVLPPGPLSLGLAYAFEGPGTANIAGTLEFAEAWA